MGWTWASELLWLHCNEHDGGHVKVLPTPTHNVGKPDNGGSQVPPLDKCPSTWGCEGLGAEGPSKSGRYITKSFIVTVFLITRVLESQIVLLSKATHKFFILANNCQQSDFPLYFLKNLSSNLINISYLLMMADSSNS